MQRMGYITIDQEMAIYMSIYNTHYDNVTTSALCKKCNIFQFNTYHNNY